MKPLAWYDPSNGAVSTDKDSPLFTPLGQVWPLYTQTEHIGFIDSKLNPIQRTWVGLTKEERHEISMANRPYCADVMAAHEEELKRRNT